MRELVEMGVDRFIVGTSLVKAAEEVRRSAEHYPGRMIAGIDARDGLVRISGWETGSQLSDTDAARLAAELGAVEIIYTNIDRDGTMEGPDIERSSLIARVSGLPLIVSGGVRGVEDFEAVYRRKSEGLKAVIAGKALYEGVFDLAEMIRTYSEEN